MVRTAETPDPRQALERAATDLWSPSRTTGRNRATVNARGKNLAAAIVAAKPTVASEDIQNILKYAKYAGTGILEE